MACTTRATLAWCVLVVVGVSPWRLPEANAEAKRFDGHQVVRLEIADEAELQTVLTLEEASEDFDLWMDDFGIGVVDVRVSPEQRIALDASDLEYSVRIDDVQELIDAEKSGLPGFFEDFRTFEEYVTLMNDLATAHPDLAEVVSLGTSHEGRDLWALRVTGPGSDKPGVLYHGMQHAREWLTPPIVAYAAQYLLTHYDTHAAVRTLVDNVEWFFMPIMNPDGYVYSWTDNRMWRKNRRDNGDGTFGVDLNRNWDLGWGGPISSGVTSSEVYRGPYPFSEPETQAVRDFLLSHGRIRAYIDAHTCGDILVYPGADTAADRATYDLLGQMMAGLVESVRGAPFMAFASGWGSGGTAMGWVYGGEGGPWTFMLEARGPHFIVPASVMIIAVEENLRALLYLGAWTGGCDPYGETTQDAYPDCDEDGVPDVCEFEDAGIDDCNYNFVSDECEPNRDCNGNDSRDICDIGDALSLDCNGNSVPDECEEDCNGNGVDDTCDIVNGTSTDCNANEIPDECDPDADGDGVTDECDPCPHENPDDFDGDGICYPWEECPYDPNKYYAGQCGCGIEDTDDDGDGIANCIDLCPGVDDTIYAPGCVGTIPTVSGWGLSIMALLLMTAAKVYRRRQIRSQAV